MQKGKMFFLYTKAATVQEQSKRQRLSKEALAMHGKILAESRQIPFKDALRMVHRRDDYERLGRLDELSPSILTDPRLERLPPTDARRELKNEKPSAKKFLAKGKGKWSYSKGFA
jgi:hypothetical protein